MANEKIWTICSGCLGTGVKEGHLPGEDICLKCNGDKVVLEYVIVDTVEEAAKILLDS